MTDMVQRILTLNDEVVALRADNERLRSLLREWDEPGACGCDTATCRGTCLAARTHVAVTDL